MTSSIAMRTLTFLLLGVAACGGGGPTSNAPPKAPSEDVRGEKNDESGPLTIAEAENQIAQARAVLEGRPGDATNATKTTEPAKPSKQAPQDAPSGRDEHGEDPCRASCRALASMRRAVEALCRLTGESDDRCTRAKRVLADTTSRAAACTCESR
jgi:hypothetical protein